LNTLQIITHKDNNGSTRIAEKLGFTWQTSLKNRHKRFDGTAANMGLYEKYRAAQ
jgi:ribosomal-protein-alanine N-acetyltransferase